MHLSNNKIGVSSKLYLFSKYNHRLDLLVLNDNQINVDCNDSCLKNKKYEMKKLFLDANNIGDKGVISIKDALLTNGSLKHLDLKNNIRISEQTRNVIASTIIADITFAH